MCLSYWLLFSLCFLSTNSAFYKYWGDDFFTLHSQGPGQWTRQRSPALLRLQTPSPRDYTNHNQPLRPNPWGQAPGGTSGGWEGKGYFILNSFSFMLDCLDYFFILAIYMLSSFLVWVCYMQSKAFIIFYLYFSFLFIIISILSLFFFFLFNEIFESEWALLHHFFLYWRMTSDNVLFDIYIFLVLRGSREVFVLHL